MKKKIYLCLLGGLGNQLFQYAFARNLQIKYNCDLILDHKTGFLFDYRDKRKFELRNISQGIKKKFVLIFLFYKIFKKIFSSKKKIIFFFKKKIVDESDCKIFYKNFLSKIEKNELYLHGFFQSEKYFSENKTLILKNIYPKKPKNKIFTKLVSKIDPDKNIAVCIRLFSEVENNHLSKIGGKLNVAFYNQKLKFFKKKIKNPHFYIFTNEENNELDNFLKKININKNNYTLVTPKRGFSNSYDTLWLLSKFKYQLISNSTFYWWGAYFAKQRFEKVFIKFSKSFPNKDTIYKGFF